MSVQQMRVELTGIVPPWPEDLTATLKEKQKQLLAEILKDLGKFDPALELAEEIGSEQVRVWVTIQILLARSRTLEKTNPVAALKDQSEALELANSIRDGVKVLGIHYEIGLGQIRMGPAEAARLTIQAGIQTLKASERNLSFQIVIQEWLRFGKLCLLSDDDANAKECFEHARTLYLFAFPGKDWDQSVANQLLLRYRCEVHRERKQMDAIPDLMADWEEAFSGMTVAKEITFAAPYLISAQVQADRFDQMMNVVQSLEDPSQVPVIQKAAEHIQKSASSAQKKVFADYVQGLHKETPRQYLTMLVVAADLSESADDKSSADRLIDEAIEISLTLKKECHPMLARWLSVNGRFKMAIVVINAIDDPKQQAQALAELAFQMTATHKMPVHPSSLRM